MPQEPTQSTQQFVDIESFKEGIIILKNGSFRSVLLVQGVNFDLKSEEEQNAILGGFQNLLNSVDFPIEVVIHSRRLNIAGYLNKINERRAEETNDLLRNQIEDYIAYVRDLVGSSTIMSKRFFVVVPYDVPQISSSAIPFKKKKIAENLIPQDFVTKKSQLERRVDVAIAGLNQIGLNVIRLNTPELIELFYNLYNPQEIEKQGLEILKQLPLT